MPTSDSAWWALAIFFIFSILSIISIFIRNKAAKTDSVGKSEKDSIATNVAIKPARNTRKLD